MTSILRSAALLCFSSAASAVTVDSYFTTSPTYVAPGFPASGSRTLSNQGFHLADGGRQTLFMTSTSAQMGYQGMFVFDGVQSTPVAVLSTSQATGPGRTGSEIAHQFFEVGSSRPFDHFEQGGNGQVVFYGKAGNPMLGSGGATRGLWLHNGIGNTEIARAGMTGVLGPGIGSLTFENSDTFARRLMYAQGGRLLVHARVGSGASFDDALLSWNGSWQPCAQDASSNDALDPGIAGTMFENLGSGWSYATLANNRVFGLNRIDSDRMGVWEFCDGGPRPLALESGSGALGPGMGPFSLFTDLRGELTGWGDDGVVVVGFGKVNDEAGTVANDGYFLIRPSGNTPIALDQRTDGYGPQLPGYTFTSFAGDNASAGEWFAFYATINGPGGSREGIFRWHPQIGIQPVALLRTAAYSPSATTFWSALPAFAVAPNGDVILRASACDRAADGVTCLGSTTVDAFWRAPVAGSVSRLLGPGDTLRYQLTGGAPGSASIGAIGTGWFNRGFGSSFDSNGRDGWLSRDGWLMAEVTITGATHYVRLRAFDPDVLLSDGFE